MVEVEWDSNPRPRATRPGFSGAPPVEWIRLEAPHRRRTFG